ncbi:HNH endonuclease [Clostridium tarantellae]|uniref:Putative HNH nuclease YajD n=2 Tax=Clostridium tarantellae TaxID=39493 RepID=A0A6I1MNG3_9CLOT|nr:HNH endonuclease [Clostridium tarantellae]MPQ44500.1 HNH endonuclease [Clostridium tarantellae]
MFKDIPSDEEVNKFYKSYTWVKVRKKVMLRDNNECQRCKEQGMFSIGQCVHHKKELKKHPELALDINNLTVLCNKCHNIVHEKGAPKNKRKCLTEERW